MSKSKDILAAPLRLPNGATLSNRLAKSAMSENLTPDHRVSEGLIRLYERWGASGAGLLITGNVMVDGRQLGEPRNLVVEDDRDLERLRRWATGAQAHGTALWMQINHPGRQAPRITSREPVAPSAVGLDLGGMFVVPRALTADEITEQIERFARTAAVAEAAGFAGVQVHAAHGYLISQFLSPKTNHRTDAWGGSLENRMRFLLEIVRAIRETVAPGFSVGVKLNSADFQRGGFTLTESMDVARALEAAGIDLLEISGGSYEKPAMMGREKLADSTRAREAFFLEYAEEIRGVTSLPLMVTGGFRTADGMAAAISSGAVDVVGMARPFTLEPDLPHRLLSGAADRATPITVRVGVKTLDGLLQTAWHQRQILRMARGLDPAPRLGRWKTIACAITEGLRAPLHRQRAA